MFHAHNVLVPMDLTHLNRQALTVALRALPADGSGGGTLHLVHTLRGLEPALKRRIVSAPEDTVIEDSISSDEIALLEVVEQAQAELMALGEPRRYVDVVPHVVAADLATACLDLCDDPDTDIDLIVAGTHGRVGLSASWKPTVTERLVQDAPCSVVVVKPAGYPILRDAAAA